MLPKRTSHEENNMPTILGSGEHPECFEMKQAPDLIQGMRPVRRFDGRQARRFSSVGCPSNIGSP
jgi:hypothetical protein